MKSLLHCPFLNKVTASHLKTDNTCRFKFNTVMNNDKCEIFFYISVYLTLYKYLLVNNFITFMLETEQLKSIITKCIISNKYFSTIIKDHI